MNKAALKRYQAGRCDAHGNRMTARDRWYLRGYFGAFVDTNRDPLTYNLEIDAKINEYYKSRKSRWLLRRELAFERGKDVL